MTRGIQNASAIHSAETRKIYSTCALACLLIERFFSPRSHRLIPALSAAAVRTKIFALRSRFFKVSRTNLVVARKRKLLVANSGRISWWLYLKSIFVNTRTLAHCHKYYQKLVKYNKNNRKTSNCDNFRKFRQTNTIFSLPLQRPRIIPARARTEKLIRTLNGARGTFSH